MCAGAKAPAPCSPLQMQDERKDAENMDMSLFGDIEFDRPIDQLGPSLAFGGFEVEMDDGEVVEFDFVCDEWEVDDENPRLVHVTCSTPDYGEFPRMRYLTENLARVRKLREFYVDTEAFDGEAAPKPLKAVDVEFALPVGEPYLVGETEFMKVTCCDSPWLCYDLSEKALEGCVLC